MKIILKDLRLRPIHRQILVEDGLREGDEWISSSARINSERRKEEAARVEEIRQGGLSNGKIKNLNARIQIVFGLLVFLI